MGRGNQMAEAFYTITYTVGPLLVALLTIGVGSFVARIRERRNR